MKFNKDINEIKAMLESMVTVEYVIKNNLVIHRESLKFDPSVALEWHNALNQRVQVVRRGLDEWQVVNDGDPINDNTLDEMANIIYRDVEDINEAEDTPEEVRIQNNHELAVDVMNYYRSRGY